MTRRESLQAGALSAWAASADDTVTPADLAATVLHLLGVPPDLNWPTDTAARSGPAPDGRFSVCCRDRQRER
jgi:hypothetical protein